MNNNIFFIGIAGGTGSGKTSIAKEIASNFSKKEITLIEQDSYYKDQSKMTLNERAKVNFDHPDSIDFYLMKTQLSILLSGKSIDIPIYDFKTHTRSNKSCLTNPHQIIIMEGILALFDLDIRKMMDLKIYVDTDDDIRIIRRINRDINKRKRTLSSVIDQYYNTVRPMHIKFVEPTKEYADIIFPKGSNNKIAIDLLLTKIESFMQSKQKYANS